ncbi:MAG: hypothetical protein ACXVW3_05270 [Nocardioidaceae bacterium]
MTADTARVPEQAAPSNHKSDHQSNHQSNEPVDETADRPTWPHTHSASCYWDLRICRWSCEG